MKLQIKNLFNRRKSQMAVNRQSADSRFGNSQSGAVAIVLVVLASVIVVSTLSTIYIYLVNRAQYHQRIRNAYQLTEVMEQFGVLMRQAADSACAASVGGTSASCPSNSGGGACPGNVPATTLANGSALCFAPCPGGSSTCACPSGGSGCAANQKVNMCVSMLGQNYCLNQNVPLAASLDSKDSGFIAKFEVEQKSEKEELFKNWYARLDRFFEASAVENVQLVADLASDPTIVFKPPTFFGWIEKQFVAQAQENNQPPTYPQSIPPTPVGTPTACVGNPLNDACLNACLPSSVGSNTGVKPSDECQSVLGAAVQIPVKNCAGVNNDPTGMCQQCAGNCIQLQYCLTGSGQCGSTSKSPVVNQVVKVL